jgi:hypothetical protein
MGYAHAGRDLFLSLIDPNVTRIFARSELEQLRPPKRLPLARGCLAALAAGGLLLRVVPPWRELERDEEEPEPDPRSARETEGGTQTGDD